MRQRIFLNGMNGSADEVCHSDRLFFRQTVFFFPESDTFHQERHVSGKHTHGKETFFVLSRLAFLSSMDTVPVAAGSDRHSADSEKFIQLIKCGGKAAPSCTDNAGADLHGLVEGGAVEKSGKERHKSSVCGSIVYRAAYDQTIALLKFRSDFVYDIVKDALSFLGAGAAGNTASYTFVAYMDQLGFNSFLFKYFFHFFQRNRSVTIFARTSI